MTKRDQDFLQAIDGHVRMYSTLPPEDTEALMALAWRGARGSEHKKLKAEIERLRAALEQISDTDPDDGTAWFHSVARAALEEGRT